MRQCFKDENLLWLIYEIIDSTDEGIPIGNLLSQWSANIYLSDFDHWIKEHKRVRFYHRYMDDIVIFGESKDYLRELYGEIVQLLNLYHLTIKRNYQIFPTYVRGLDFLGYRFFNGYTLLRKRTAKSMKRKMKAIRRKVARGGRINQHDYGSINSYSGWLKHADCYRLRSEYIAPLLPYCDEYYREVIKHDRPRAGTSDREAKKA